MHPPELRARVLTLTEQGLSDGDVGSTLGLARGTVRYIRLSGRRDSLAPLCPKCWRPDRGLCFSRGDYAELFGLYLGDGHLAQTSRTFRLRVALDVKYPGIILDLRALLRRCFPKNSVDEVQTIKRTHVVVSVYSSHLPCLFPQHGLGRKHKRRIALETWQVELIEAAPWSFIKGCIRSDGCVFINRTGPYRYLSYQFSNKSKDIVDLFLWACELVGVSCRVNVFDEKWSVRINRRPSVAAMLTHVGVKA